MKNIPTIELESIWITGAAEEPIAFVITSDGATQIAVPCLAPMLTGEVVPDADNA